MEILKEVGIPDHLNCLLKICMQFKKQQLELDMEQWTGSKLGKKYIKTVYGHLAFLTSRQNASLVASLVAQLVKTLPAMWDTWGQSLGWEDPLEKGKATHSSILAWRIPGTL